MCYSCFLGTVKKLSMMKIVHEKYKNTKKQEDPLITDFKNSFQAATENNKELGSLINKAQELLNPLKVLQLFENVPNEVCAYNVFIPLKSNAEFVSFTGN